MQKNVVDRRDQISIGGEFDLKVWLAAKKGQDEIDLSKEPKEELEGWKLADAAEWAKIEASGAVRVLSTAESEQVKAQLNKENKLDRILPTKVVRRRKPAEQLVKNLPRSLEFASEAIWIQTFWT